MSPPCAAPGPAARPAAERNPARLARNRRAPGRAQLSSSAKLTKSQCSLPGCFGAVRGDFVREVTGGYAGLCSKYERHEELIAENPEYDDLWTELSAQNEQARREWRASHGDSSGGLLDRAIRCSLSGCEGIVKPEYVFDVNGVKTGLCPQRSLHRVLARRNPAVADELRGLEATNRAAWIERTYGSLRTDLLLDGGIPCSVLGCDGIVGRGFIITTEDGEAGICGLSAEHRRLIAEDPEARREFERVQVLELELRRPWSSANGASWGGELDSLDDLPL
jgi:hypothetical protein